jgi:hypothetical protein
MFSEGPKQGCTPNILSILGNRTVKGNFFLSGYNLDPSNPNSGANDNTLQMVLNEGHFIGDNSFSGFDGATSVTCNYVSAPSCITDYNNNWSIVSQVLTPFGFSTASILPAFQKNKRIPCFNTWRVNTSQMQYTNDCSYCGSLQSQQVVSQLVSSYASTGTRIFGWTMQWCPMQTGYSIDSNGKPICGPLTSTSTKQSVCGLIVGLESGTIAPFFNKVAQRVLLIPESAFDDGTYEGRQNLIQLDHLIHLLTLRGHTFSTIDKMGIPQ